MYLFSSSFLPIVLYKDYRKIIRFLHLLSGIQMPYLVINIKGIKQLLFKWNSLHVHLCMFFFYMRTNVNSFCINKTPLFLCFVYIL